ncbi:hypothetical protein M3Y98_00697600 [Aphelenchoides besseyi]|nr:hypothetical protein M3Y98_00697600 [Aphelenchoides besseyi]
MQIPNFSDFFFIPTKMFLRFRSFLFRTKMGGRILKLPPDLHEPTMKSSGSTVSAQPAPGYEVAQQSEPTPPPSTGPILVHFVVHCRSIRPTEFLFLTGSNEKLGNWEPAKAIELAQDKQNESLWRTKIELRDIETRDMLKFRYFIGCYLQSSSEASKQRLIRRWESQRSSRTLLPSVENVNGECRAKHVDEFGVFGGKEMISDGWLTHKNQSEILLRLYGPALKFFKPRHAKRSYYIKVTAFDLRYKEEFTPYENSGAQKKSPIMAAIIPVGTEDGIEEDDTHSPLPSLPSFTSTDLAILTHENPNFHVQDAHGELFRNGDDYFIFRTQSIAVEFLAFRVEFFTEKRRPNDKSSSSESLREIRLAPTILIDSPVQTTTSMSTPSITPPPSVSLLPPSVAHLELERVALAYCMPTAMLDSYGQLIVPILAKSQLPIGQLTIDYLFVRAMARDPHPALSMEVSYCQHWKKRRTVEVGHRGFGNSYTKFSSVRENTIHSLNHAIKKGADFVEFDVQLTKDKIAVIFHDFHVLVSVAKRTHLSTPTDGSSGPQRKSKPNADHHEIAVKDLKLEQLQLLHVEHYKAMENEDKVKLSNTADESPELRPFPTLIDALKHVNKDAGFNIEIKFPMTMQDGVDELQGSKFFERNEYIDTILEAVIEHAGSRRILFSSFEPDICYLIARKQNLYPVLFLCVGATTRYVPFLDKRSSTSLTAVNFAAATQLLGVNFHSEELLRDKRPVKRANHFNLISFVWGDDLDSSKNIDYFRNSLNVDGIIYDKIGEIEKRQNCFVLERELRSMLFQRGNSPSPSRRSSLDDCTAIPTTNALLLADHQLKLPPATPVLNTSNSAAALRPKSPDSSSSSNSLRE